MPMATLAYLLGGASFSTTFIVTVLDGICYASSKSSIPNNSTIEFVIVVLSSISCVALIALLSLWINDARTDFRPQQKRWRAISYGMTLAYLLVATGVTAGGIGWSAVQTMTGTKRSWPENKQSMLVARCVLWAISILCQGILGGYLLTTLTKRNQDSQWPNLISHELEYIPDRCRAEGKEASKTPSLIIDSQRQSLDPRTSCEPQSQIQPSTSRSASQGSNRYSGKTLFQPTSKSNSLDLNPTFIAYPETVATRTRPEGCQEDQDNETVLGDNYSAILKIQRSNSGVKRSLDGVVLQPSSVLSSPSSSTTQLVPNKRPPKLKLPDESNIHPLFRSDSRSPPPTPTPGTIVIASPAAGQTISVQTLNRVRSTRSVGAHTPRSRSPLFERMDQSCENIQQVPEQSLEGHIMDRIHSDGTLKPCFTPTSDAF